MFPLISRAAHAARRCEPRERAQLVSWHARLYASCTMGRCPCSNAHVSMCAGTCLDKSIMSEEHHCITICLQELGVYCRIRQLCFAPTCLPCGRGIGPSFLSTMLLLRMPPSTLQWKQQGQGESASSLQKFAGHGQGSPASTSLESNLE